MNCPCKQTHYPLQFFIHPKNGMKMATRGTIPVKNAKREGWLLLSRELIGESIARVLEREYNKSHRFDWLHTPTYLDDTETHLRMKALTSRVS